MKNQTTQEKYLNVLNEISQRKRGFTDIRSIFSKFKVSVAMQKALTEKNLIVRDDLGIWRWTGKMPDAAMANSVLNTVNRGIRNANRENETSSDETHEIKGKKQSTEEKYLNFLTVLYSRERGFRSFAKMIKKYKMCSSISSVLKKVGVVQNELGVWNWIGKKPDMNMAKLILRDVNQSIVDSVNSKNKNTGRMKGILNNPENQIRSEAKEKVKVAKKSNDILSLSELRAEKTTLQNRIAKIDSLLESIENFHNN